MSDISKILKIKYHSRRLLPISRRDVVKFSFDINSYLDEILDLVNVDKKRNIVCGSVDMIFDDNHIFFSINNSIEEFINDKISKSDKIKKLHKDKEFEIITKETETGL